MDIIPAKDNKGIWTIVIITLVLVGLIFLNMYTGPNRQPLFGFLKRKTEPITTTV